MAKPTPTLRERMAKRLFRTTADLPIMVYGAVVVSLVIVWSFRSLHEDISLNLFSELLGAAFTLFIIDTLLVRSKTNRWKIVQEHVDYLIARDVNRIRDGLATRVFGFSPKLDLAKSEESNLALVREQRAHLFLDLARLSEDELERRLVVDEVFSQRTHDYFNEKAADVWSILNMKYSEYLAPELVSLLIELHTQLRDSAAHIRQYLKKDRFAEQEAYYQSVGINGISASLKSIIGIVNTLKDEGYSEAARR